MGQKSYPSIGGKSLSHVDLAVIATPAKTVPGHGGGVREGRGGRGRHNLRRASAKLERMELKLEAEIKQTSGSRYNNRVSGTELRRYHTASHWLERDLLRDNPSPVQ